jgi:hypothetical protein
MAVSAKYVSAKCLSVKCLLGQKVGRHLVQRNKLKFKNKIELDRFFGAVTSRQLDILSITYNGATILGITTFSITTFSITTKGLFVTHIMYDT